MVKGWGRVWGGLQGAKPQGLGTKKIGDSAKSSALSHLQQQGLRLLCRNYRLAGGPHQPGAEIDLILSDGDGTLVFVEVRARRDRSHGGAAGSVSLAKRQRIVRAAQHYLLRLSALPPCRFDVVAIEGDKLQWLRGAFEG